MITALVVRVLYSCIILLVSSTSVSTTSNGRGSRDNRVALGECGGLPKLDVLPGLGWDNLRNEDMGQVTAINYKQCKATPDGRFLIPDNTFLVPVKESDVQIFSEVIDSWKNYTSVTSRSFNLESQANSNRYNISGTFSWDYQSTKGRQVDEKATTFRVHARYTMYVVGIIPTTDLDPQFQTILFTALRALEANNTDKADFLLELLVRDYGTHLITRMDAGGIVMQEDFVNRQFSANFTQDTSQLRAAASASFFRVFKFDTSYTHKVNDAVLKAYTDKITSSHVTTFGGTFFKPNSTVDDWVGTIPDNLAGIDRRGVPLNFIITPYLFPDVSLEMLDALQTHLENAISNYYAVNEHFGCTAVDSKHFDYNANIDDNQQCQNSSNNYTFGGLFQNCTGKLCFDKKLEFKNPLTGGFSCPPNYTEVALLTGEIRDDCHTKCRGRWIFRKCRKICPKSSAVYTASWCAALGNVSKNTGVMFGGLFTSEVDNPVTNAQSCPPTFLDQVTLRDLHVCIGTDYELGRKYSVEFGGFFSCQRGNPLYSQLKNVFKRLKLYGNTYIQGCPAGYTQHPAIVHQGCLVHYCVKANSFGTRGEMPIVTPPFLSIHSLYLGSESKSNSGHNSWPQMLSGGAIAGIVIGCLVLVGVIAFGVWKYKIRKGRSPHSSESYARISSDEPNTSVD